MTTDDNAPAHPEFKDRKVGLVIFGILQIVFGGVCALMVPLMLFSMIGMAALDEGAVESVSPSMMAPGLVFYVLLAVWFIWMGIGSIMARRWARALLLVTSWLWLVSGILGLLMVIFILPEMYEMMGADGQLPPEAITIIKYVMIGFMGFFYVVAPGVLVFFYGSRHVKATCERRDPKVRWTDKCPLPVLAVSITAGGWGACMLLMGFYAWALPFFGVIISGIAGMAVTLFVMLLCGYIAWGTYRLDIKAWWCAVVMVVAWAVSAGLTFSRATLIEYYEAMNFPEQQLEIMRPYNISTSSIMAISGVYVVVALAYLVYTKRYFVRPE